MKKEKVKSLGDLEKGIKQLLLENRYSFSDEEKVLLNEVLLLIKQAKRSQNVTEIVRIFKIISRLVVTENHLNNLF